MKPKFDIPPREELADVRADAALLRADNERLRAHNKVLCDNQHDHVRYCTRIHEQDAEIERLQEEIRGTRMRIADLEKQLFRATGRTP